MSKKIETDNEYSRAEFEADQFGNTGTRIVEKKRIVHLANKINEKGQASALCSKKPRAINMKTSTYVFYQPEAITCKKCQKIIKAQEGVDEKDKHN